MALANLSWMRPTHTCMHRGRTWGGSKFQQVDLDATRFELEPGGHCMRPTHACMHRRTWGGSPSPKFGYQLTYLLP